MSIAVKIKRTQAEREKIRQEVMAREVAAFDQYVWEQVLGMTIPMPEHLKSGSERPGKPK